MRERDLDGLFREARAQAPLPSAALMERIAADAVREAALRALPVPVARRRRRGWLFDFGAFSGRGALAGLVTATVAGVWLGAAQPAPVQSVTDGLASLLGDASGDGIELMPAFDSDPVEG